MLCYGVWEKVGGDEDKIKRWQGIHTRKKKKSDRWSQKNTTCFIHQCCNFPQSWSWKQGDVKWDSQVDEGRSMDPQWSQVASSEIQVIPSQFTSYLPIDPLWKFSTFICDCKSSCDWPFVVSDTAKHQDQWW